MDFWSARKVLDDASWEFVNWVQRGVTAAFSYRSRWGLARNAELKNRHAGKPAFILGNGPTIGQADLESLHDEVCFSVNRGFQLPDYEKMQPSYHVIVDPKLADGTWPITWLDEIAEKNPSVTFLLNSKWATRDDFKAIASRHCVRWLPTHMFFTPWTRSPIDLTRLTVGGAVVEQGIVAAIYMGCNPIFLLGFECNGFFLRVAGQTSHFYGINKEDEHMSTMDLADACYSASLSFRRLRDISAFAERHGVSIVNLTPGSLVDFFERDTLEHVLAMRMGAKGVNVE